MIGVELRDRVSGLMGRAHSDLAELVAIRSVADARQFPPEECARAAGWVRDRFAELGFVDLELAETADGSRAVVGSRPAADPGAPTVLLYAHYDVQPPLDEQAWRSPPFALTQRDGRWYGRGAADCKGNIVMHLTALRALGDDIPVNLKLVVEGSEEQGTGGLEDYVPAHADQLRADAILVCDTGNAAVGVPALTVSLRGLADVVVTVETLGVRGALRDVRRRGSGRAGRPDRHARHAARRRRQHHRRGSRQHRDVDRGGLPAGRVPGRCDACSTGCRCWATGRSPTCCGRGRRSPSSASTARRWSGRRPRSSRGRRPGSTCASRPARTPTSRSRPWQRNCARPPRGGRG